MVKFIQSSLEDLFTNHRYMVTFYLIGTVVLGSIAASIESTKVTSNAAIWLIIFLAIPLHFVLYASRMLSVWFIEKSMPHELALHQSVLNAYQGKRLVRTLELLVVAHIISALLSIIVLLLALLSGGELPSSRNESRKAV